MTVRAKEIGFLMRVKPHTAPARRVLPSMIESVEFVAAIEREHGAAPALNDGSSSS